MWRLIYAKRKLKPQEKLQLEQSLSNMSFLCGAQMQDADIPIYLHKQEVCVCVLTIFFNTSLLLNFVYSPVFCSTLCALCLILCVHCILYLSHVMHCVCTKPDFVCALCCVHTGFYHYVCVL